MTRGQDAANVVISGQRIVVEWGFGSIAKYWALNSFKSSWRLGLSPIAGYYMVATLAKELFCGTSLPAHLVRWMPQALIKKAQVLGASALVHAV